MRSFADAVTATAFVRCLKKENIPFSLKSSVQHERRQAYMIEDCDANTPWTRGHNLSIDRISDRLFIEANEDEPRAQRRFSRDCLTARAPAAGIKLSCNCHLFTLRVAGVLG
jgi:hypothetical protein